MELESSNTKKIARNTMLLYLRMAVNVIIGLYTSRLVLHILGVENYGIYNVVGGVVYMLAFLNSAMAAATQRFLSFELGKGNLENLKKVFATSVIVHLIIAGIIFIVAETIGLWFLNTHMNIAESRMNAANWVYQCSILTFILTIVSVPYNACIISHERMGVFTYISILEMSLKLLTVFLLQMLYGDKLIIYAILILVIAFVIRIIYGIYCKKQFQECTYHFVYDRKLFANMFSFAGWSVIGNLGITLKDNGSNIILNLFWGTILNGARGIAMQVTGIINNFSANFIMALVPQVTKQYAAGNIETSMKLVYGGCKFSFYLLAMVAIPVMINIDYILQLWLVNVPAYTSDFLFLALIVSMIHSMATPLVAALQATGHIRNFQITICIIMACELPLVYAVFSMGYLPYYMMIPSIMVTCVALFARFCLLKRLIPQYSLGSFTFMVLRCYAIVTLCYLVSSQIKDLYPSSFFYFVLTSFLSFVITLLGIIIGGLSKDERNFICARIKARIKNS